MENGRLSFLVTKFLPEECPKCRQIFRDPSKNYSLLLGDIVDGKKVFRLPDHYDIIICTACKNQTARVKIEQRHVFNIAEANQLIEQGFTCIEEGRSFGTQSEQKFRFVFPYGIGLEQAYPMKILLPKKTE